MNFIKYSTIYFIIGIVVVIASIVCLSVFGLKLGMDFEGGSSLQVDFAGARPSNEEIKTALAQIQDFKNAEIQPLGQSGVVLKINQKDISSQTYNDVLSALKTTGNITENSASIETISPLVGKELRNKTIVVALVALLAMLLYIALAFRSISRPMSSFGYGLSSTLMLFHDIIIPLGALSIFGYLYGAQLTIPVVTALLTIVGYCINNTVVVFDRIRENLIKDRKASYDEIVNKSLNETFSRCINTSLTVLLALIPLYYFFVGEENLKYFTLTIGIGVIAGIYSSIFLASPVLAQWLRWRGAKTAKIAGK